MQNIWNLETITYSLMSMTGGHLLFKITISISGRHFLSWHYWHHGLTNYTEFIFAIKSIWICKWSSLKHQLLSECSTTVEGESLTSALNALALHAGGSCKSSIRWILFGCQWFNIIGVNRPLQTLKKCVTTAPSLHYSTFIFND